MFPLFLRSKTYQRQSDTIMKQNSFLDMDNDKYPDSEFDDVFEISSIISKYLTLGITPHEEAILRSWRAKAEKNELFFRKVTSKNHWKDEENIAETNDASSIHQAFNLFMCYKQRRDNQKRRKKIIRYTQYAAVWIALVMCVGYFFFEIKRATPDVLPIKPIEAVGQHVPFVVLENGNRIAITQENKDALQAYGIDLAENASVTVADAAANPKKIETPRSSTFRFLLPDGTAVFMNSQSSVSYSNLFAAAKERRVTVSGEVFLDVAKDVNRPFIVHLNQMQIKVLGTSFNIKAYDDSEFIRVTLAKGLIRTKAGNSEFTVDPGQQLFFDKNTQHSLLRYVNVEDETGWMHGVYTFKEESLKEIARVIEDWYNVNVIFETAASSDIVYTGIIKKEMSLQVFTERLQKSSENIRCRIENNNLYIR